MVPINLYKQTFPFMSVFNMGLSFSQPVSRARLLCSFMCARTFMVALSIYVWAFALVLSSSVLYCFIKLILMEHGGSPPLYLKKKLEMATEIISLV